MKRNLHTFIFYTNPDELLQKIFGILSIDVLFYSRGLAQIFGGNPPSVQWKQINTPLVRVIFPRGLDSTAERITNIISFIDTANTTYNWQQDQKRLTSYFKTKLPFQMLMWALRPFRSEFFITPFQNSFELGQPSLARSAYHS